MAFVYSFGLEDDADCLPGQKRQRSGILPASADRDHIRLIREREALSNFIDEIAERFQLPFSAQDANRNTSANSDGLGQKVAKMIQYLWWKDFDKLLEATDRFEETPGSKSSDALRDFYLLVKTQYDSVKPQSRTTSANTSFSSEAGTPGVSRLAASATKPIAASSLENTVQRTTKLQPKTTTPKPVTSSPKQGTPVRTVEVTKDDTPVLQDYRIRDLPSQADDLPVELMSASSWVRYEATRLAHALNVSLNDVVQSHAEDSHQPYSLRNVSGRSHIAKQWQDYGTMWDAFKAIPRSNLQMPSKPATSAWTEAQRDSEYVIRSGSLKFESAKSQNLFRLELEPLKLDERSNRFTRQFGAHRFLSLTIPRLSKLPREMRTSDDSSVRSKIAQWLMGPDKPLMGCKWSAFYARDFKKDKRENTDTQNIPAFQVYFFATAGPGLKTISVTELINWFMPFDLNSDQKLCKGFARLQLGLSRTLATLVFKPSQIFEVDDDFADGAPEDKSLRDMAQRWPKLHDKKGPRVMNDGCSVMSFAAAQTIWSMLEKAGPCPSAFQARMGPWKGMWMVAAPQQGEEYSEEIWIRVTPSQRKFRRHDSDYDDKRFDPNRLTFEVANWPTKPNNSNMYIYYLPILEDRGVSRQTLAKYMTDALHKEYMSLQNIVEDPTQLRRVVESRFGATAGRDIPILGGLPKGKADRARLLLDSGFSPKKSPFLAELVSNLLTKYLTNISNEMTIPLENSTTVYGVADPIGCLEPDEIYIAFSGSLGEGAVPMIYGYEALVSRHPALLNSDIQKVRIVFKPQLQHLVNVVVFPSTGCFPLASKLQGGDYDGDLFWICWDRAIVSPFYNAPPRVNVPPPESFNIVVDKTLFGDVIRDKSSRSTAQFLGKCFEFTLQESIFGMLTNFHGKLCYAENRIQSQNVETIADLHGYLIDSTKNGYSFGWSEWSKFLQDIGVDSRIDSLVPAYKKADEIELGEEYGRNFRPNPNNIIDHLIFEVTRTEASKIRDEIRAQLRSDITIPISTPVKLRSPNSKPHEALDEHLTFVYERYTGSQDPSIRSELEILTKSLDKLSQELASVRRKMVHAEKGTKIDYDYWLRIVSKRYEDIRPQNLNHPDIRQWTARVALGMPTTWELLKASTAYVKTSMRPYFAFETAGHLLCHLKAHAVDASKSSSEQNYDDQRVLGAHTIVSSIYSEVKTRKQKSSAIEAQSFSSILQTYDTPAKLGNADTENKAVELPSPAKSNGETPPSTRERTFHDAFEHMSDLVTSNLRMSPLASRNQASRGNSIQRDIRAQKNRGSHNTTGVCDEGEERELAKIGRIYEENLHSHILQGGTNPVQRATMRSGSLPLARQAGLNQASVSKLQTADTKGYRRGSATALANDKNSQAQFPEEEDTEPDTDTDEDSEEQFRIVHYREDGGDPFVVKASQRSVSDHREQRKTQDYVPINNNVGHRTSFQSPLRRTSPPIAEVGSRGASKHARVPSKR